MFFSGTPKVLQKPSLFEKIRNLAQIIRHADSVVTGDMLYGVWAQLDHRLNVRRGTKWWPL